MPASTALNAMKCARVTVRDQARERGLAGAGRPPQDQRLQPVLLDRAGAAVGPVRAALLADELVERARPHALGERRRSDRPAAVERSASSKRDHRTATWRALARGFVQHERGGDGHVQRLDRRAHRNRDARVGRRDAARLAARRLRRRAAARRRRKSHSRRAASRRAARRPASADARGAQRAHRVGDRHAWRSAIGTRCPSRRAAPSSRTGSAVPAPATTPVAPQASAVRMIAPTLPGSCTPTEDRRAAGGRSSTSSSGAGGHAARCATTPDGCVHRAHRGKHRVGCHGTTRAPLCAVRAAASRASLPAARRMRRRRSARRDASASSTRCAPSSSTARRVRRCAPARGTA